MLSVPHLGRGHGMITEDRQDDDDEPVAGGLAESQDVFQPDASVRAMTDDALLNAYRALSNPRATLPSARLSEIELEVRARGLLREH